MESSRLVTFLSDFGAKSGYAAACELVIYRLTPTARVLNLSHDISPGDVSAGAWLLRRLLPWGPPATHLAVVDPGVGTTRRALCLVCNRGDHLVGPDNGLLVPAADALGGTTTAWALSHERIRELAGIDGDVSHTFHGRDVFAPAVALLLQGEPPGVLGDPIHPAELVHLEDAISSTSSAAVCAAVSEVDVFGNVQLSLEWSRAMCALHLPDDPSSYGTSHGAGGQTVSGPIPNGEVAIPASAWVQIRAHGGDYAARQVRTYAELEPGELGLLEDSWGRAALVMRGQRAADMLQLTLHDHVELSNLPHPGNPVPTPYRAPHGPHEAK